MAIRSKRREMGEEAWAEYQKKRKLDKAIKYRNTAKGKRAAFDLSERRRYNKKELIKYKGGKCVRCGYNKDIPSAYDFHHLDPSKKDFIIAAKRNRIPTEILIKEVDKCDLLCKNCHAEVHYELEQIKNEERKRLFERSEHEY